ncbi:thioredoxin [Actinomycetaceae bacterium TAE3-ERU4]|nr:thioredoxin [Actinomycetaceae bacterium TAE3-ERU4]
MKKIITASILTITSLAGILTGCSSTTEKAPETAASNTSTMEASKMSMNEGNGTMESPSSHAMKKSGYISYSTYRENPSAYNDGKTVLFFNAQWCPTCKAADAAFKENTNLIPEGYTLVSVDYDTNTDLRQKYGVTMQHTFVQLGQNGDAINKWSGGSAADFAQLIKE